MQPDPNALDEVPALKATLELVQKAAGSNSTGQQMKPSALTATYLLFSSLDGEFSSNDRILTDIGHRLSQVLSVHNHCLFYMNYCQPQGQNDIHLSIVCSQTPAVKLTFGPINSHVSM